MKSGEAIVRLENVSKSFGDKKIIKSLTLDIFEGEFLTLLGPSGCGKTTVLRLISGLESVSSGKVYISGSDVTELPASKRPVNTIFQNFALFPHLTVFKNINFGLKITHIPRFEAEKRIRSALRLVKLSGFEDRYPSQLSGGQQQRVAIARGIVLKHKLLLLDESLASLDLKLKREMQTELKNLQEKLAITFVYVTHDQDEALTMSDRIAVMNAGRIIQLGTPEEIYKNPKNAFVSSFISDIDLINFQKTRLARYKNHKPASSRTSAPTPNSPRSSASIESKDKLPSSRSSDSSEQEKKSSRHVPETHEQTSKVIPRVSESSRHVPETRGQSSKANRQVSENSRQIPKIQRNHPEFLERKK
ncbi:ATP-binding cassette domain-containing protein [Candidatus Saccharibacteria bacterium]|nr:ATP-binding cassette domain-containing protein [Candidatus Saccharibacteria bacterium]